MQERFIESFYRKVEKSVLRYLDHLAVHAQEAQESSTQLMREGLIAHVLIEIGPQEMPTGLRPQALGTRRLRRRYDAMSARQ